MCPVLPYFNHLYIFFSEMIFSNYTIDSVITALCIGSLDTLKEIKPGFSGRTVRVFNHYVISPLDTSRVKFKQHGTQALWLAPLSTYHLSLPSPFPPLFKLCNILQPKAYPYSLASVTRIVPLCLLSPFSF